MRNQGSALNLRRLNMNLLPILERLLSTRSVTKTAQILHMSQSGVSDSLARMRLQFRDELLVRRGREMVLTSLAQELLPQLNEIVFKVEEMLRTPEFDPGLMDREFVVATADPVVMVIGAALCRIILEEAPLTRIRFVDLRRGDYDRLRGMEIDLVITPEGYIRKDGLAEEPVYQEPFVCIARRDHPAIGKRLTPSIYERLAHITFQTDEGIRPSMEARLIDLDEHDVMKVTSFSLLPFLVERTDAIALVQSRVVERFAESTSIEVYDPPVPIPPLDVCMYWSAGHEQDPGHRWFRQQVRSIASSL